jgi:hypothetical protein
MTSKQVFIHLLHGRDDPDQEMTDWGFTGPLLGPFEAVHFTYKEHIRCIVDANAGAELELGFHGDLLVHDGKFYGDFEICAGHGPAANSAPPRSPSRWSYTPEWISAEKKGTTGKFIIRDERGEFICKVEGKRNAKLISAAPDLEAIVRAKGGAEKSKPEALPPDPEGRNGDRAEWAAAAIRHFQCHTGTDWEDAVADLLCDLIHFCDREGFDFAHELDRARMHYEAETTASDAENKIVIEVLDGIARVKTCPAGVEVEIINHDHLASANTEGGAA